MEQTAGQGDTSFVGSVLSALLHRHMHTGCVCVSLPAKPVMDGKLILIKIAAVAAAPHTLLALAIMGTEPGECRCPNASNC